MANGTIHKLGTLYVANAKKARPTKPWYGTNGSAPSTGNLLDYGNGSDAIGIKDTDSNDAYKLQWVEVNDGSDKILICDRNLLCNITWDRLNTLGFCGTKGRGKKITIDGQQYELFMLTGGASSSAQTETAASNEWDKYIGNLGKFSRLPTPQSQDLQNSGSSANFATAHNKIWNWAGCYSWCQNTTTDGSSYRACRGYYGARCWNYFSSSYCNSGFGWRPALRVLNAAPQIAPASKSYGELNKPINIDYTINDSDGDKFNIIVKIDGTQKESYQSQSSGSFSLVLSKYWSALSIGSHTVAITATDTKNAATTVTYTFTKKNGPAAAPTIISPANGERRDSDFYVEFNIGADSEGDTQTLKVQMSGNSGFSNSKEFTSLEKYVGEQWVSAASASNEDVGTKFRIKVTGASGEVYLRVVSTDSGSLSEARSSAAHIRIGTILDVQTHPQETADRAQKMVVLLDLVSDDKVTKEIWVANNANDASPAWETYAPDSAGNHTFQNTAKAAEKWAVAARVKATANNSTGEIALRAIGMGVL